MALVRKYSGLLQLNRLHKVPTVIFFLHAMLHARGLRRKGRTGPKPKYEYLRTTGVIRSFTNIG